MIFFVPRMPDDEDDFDFAERFSKIKTELEEQMKEKEKLIRL